MELSGVALLGPTRRVRSGQPRDAQAVRVHAETSELLKELLGEAFAADVVTVVTGGPQVGQAFSRLPFDHLLFTGSTRVGKLVMHAAAENLDAGHARAGRQVADHRARELPGRQGGRAHPVRQVDQRRPDLHRARLLCSSRRQARRLGGGDHAGPSTRFYPTLKENPDYTSVVNESHYKRLRGYVDDAVARRAAKVEVNPASESLDRGTRKIAPTMLLDVNDDMA